MGFGAVSGHCRGGEYGGCCRSFASKGGFERHRTGRHGVDRRCLTDAEMFEAGWTQREDGWWVVPSEDRPAHWAAGRARVQTG